MATKVSELATALHCDYQRDIDLLFAWIGQPRDAENIEVESGIYVRVEPTTKDVIGIEVLDCAERFSLTPDRIDANFAATLIENYRAAALQGFAEQNPRPTLFSSSQ